MDRNTIIGLVLIAGIVLTWTIFFNGDDDKPTTTPPTTEVAPPGGKGAGTTSPGTPNGATSDPLKPIGMTDSAWAALPDSTRQAMVASAKKLEHGDFSPIYEGTDRIVEVETDKYKVEIHTQGARMGSLILKDYQTADSLPLPIQLDKPNNSFSVNFKQMADVKYPLVNSRDLYFESAETAKVEVKGDAKRSVSFKAKLDEGHYLELLYTFKGNAYDYDLVVRQVGLDGLIEARKMGVEWNAEIPKTERTMQLMREKTAVYYRESGSVDDLGAGKSLDQPEPTENRVDWVAFHSQFFTHTLMTADEAQSLENVKVWQGMPAGPNPDDVESGNVVSQMSLTYDLTIGTKPEDSVKYTFFAGPLDFDVLKGYGREMHQQIALGWGPLKYINRFLTIPVFNLLEDFIGNYGIIILLLGLIIKTLIYPLTYRTYISTAKMRLVNSMPEVKALDAKYKDDPTKLQQEKMAYYRTYGVSMLGGCWPMLIQYPFLIALFFFFPNSIELRQQSFLWAPDLSTYDSILDLPFTIPAYGNHVSLFTLLMTLSIFAYTIVNQRMQPQQVNNPVMKWFPYIMPIILLGFLNRYSAGLSWYYLLSNLISIAQTLITKQFVSDEKLLDKLRAYAKDKAADPNKKKGTLERWAERQQQRQREIMEQRSAAGGESNGGQPKRGDKYTAPKKRK